jgi:hypothetical protein
MGSRVSFSRGWGAFLLTLVVVGHAGAQSPAPDTMPGPSNSTELGLVVAAGNARSTSVGLRNVFGYRLENAELRWEAGWLRVESRSGRRFAVGTPDTFAVVDPDTTVNSERLFSKVRYQQQFSARTDWFTNFDAVRDEPANISHQFVMAGGLGTTWIKTDRATFRTAYGFTYTDEDLVVTGSHRFGGYRLYYGLKVPLGVRSAFDSELTADGSFLNREDIRGDWLNSLSVPMTENMALRSGVRLLFRNLPALELIELRNASGTLLGAVEVPKATVDTNITTSLVITF